MMSSMIPPTLHVPAYKIPLEGGKSLSSDNGHEDQGHHKEGPVVDLLLRRQAW